MNRLQPELERLYQDLPRTTAEPADAVRAMVLELASPLGWDALAPVWRGVQAELELPAPAIAVSGTDGLQLWFSLHRPVAPARARAFLLRLCERFLPDVDARRVRLMTGQEARPVPALQEQTGNWSAFLAPDLASVFGDTPWLDIAPNEEGQASLLRGMASMQPDAFEAAMAQLGPGAAAPLATVSSAPLASQPQDAAADPRRFLRQVMQDDTVPMALRIEAAKALLQSSAD